MSRDAGDTLGPKRKKLKTGNRELEAESLQPGRTNGSTTYDGPIRNGSSSAKQKSLPPTQMSMSFSSIVRSLQQQTAALEQSRAFNPNQVVGSISLNDFDFSVLLDTPINQQRNNLDNQGAQRDDGSTGMCSDALVAEDVSQFVLNKQSMDQDFGLLREKALASSKSKGTAFLPVGLDNRAHQLLDGLGLTKGNLRADEQGQLHYFGYSSNLQLVSMLPSSPSLPAPLSPLGSVHEDLEELANSSRVQSNLLQLFFRYQNPAAPLVEEETFMENYNKRVKTQYFSSFLLYSILLRSLRLSDGNSVKELAGVYLSRARAELLSELENPTVATVQALCIFGHYLGSLGDDRACWLYPGMAYRLIFDLGLHQDSQELVNAGCLTEHDRRARHFTMWGCYITDKFYSSFQGRPTTLKLSDIIIPHPTSATVGQQHQALLAWIGLATIVDSIINIINGPFENLSQPNTISALSKIGEQLLQWLKDLPPSMQWNPKSASLPDPGICALHIQFLTTTILLHRPFAAYMIRKSPGSNRKQHQNLNGYTPQTSQQICTANAIRIIKILLAFQRKYGIEKIFSTVVHVAFTAALSLISEIATAGGSEDRSNEIKWLTVCFRILADLGATLPVIERNLKILFSILESCGYPELGVEAQKQNSSLNKRTTQLTQQLSPEASSDSASSPDHIGCDDFWRNRDDGDRMDNIANNNSYGRKNNAKNPQARAIGDSLTTSNITFARNPPFPDSTLTYPFPPLTSPINFDGGHWNPSEFAGGAGAGGEMDMSFYGDVEQAGLSYNMLASSQVNSNLQGGNFIGIGQEFGFDFSGYL